MHTGTVTNVNVDRGFGFIAEPGSPDVFFHCSDLSDGLTFNESLRERRVTFDVVSTAKGPRATNVQAAV